MRIAIIGSGISGLTAAHHLHPRHDVTVFEADDRVGGHANTVPMHLDDGDLERRHRLHRLQPAQLPGLLPAPRRSCGSRPSRATCRWPSATSAHGLEWGTNVSRLFSQRRNAVEPPVPRDGRRDPPLEPAGPAGAGRDGRRRRAGPGRRRAARRKGFSSRFFEWYLVPLAAAVWSADPTTVDRFPIGHLLPLPPQPRDALARRPAAVAHRDRRVAGLRRGAHRAVRRPHPHVDARRRRSRRTGDGVEVRDRRLRRAGHLRPRGPGHPLRPGPAAARRCRRRWRRTWPAPSGTSPTWPPSTPTCACCPPNPRTWASWNVHVLGRRPAPGDHDVPHEPAASRWPPRHQICVTLNRHDDIDPATVHARIDYDHPVFDAEAIAAQRRRDELQGRGGLYWAGAWWGYGFHEDGARSGRRRRPPRSRPADDRRPPRPRHSAPLRGHRPPRPVRRPAHAFTYRVLMAWLDLDELPGALDAHPLWSARRRGAGPVPPPGLPRRPGGAPRRRRARHGRARSSAAGPTGPIRMLAHLRTWGWSFNPIVFYFVFTPDGAEVEALVAEVTNTPVARAPRLRDAGPRHRGPTSRSASPRRSTSRRSWTWTSTTPWRSRRPAPTDLTIRMDDWRGDERVFAAELDLHRLPLDRPTMGRAPAPAPAPRPAGLGGHLPRGPEAARQARPVPPPPRTRRLARATGLRHPAPAASPAPTRTVHPTAHPARHDQELPVTSIISPPDHADAGDRRRRVDPPPRRTARPAARRTRTPGPSARRSSARHRPRDRASTRRPAASC